MRCVSDDDNHRDLKVWRAQGYPALAYRFKLMLFSIVIVTPTAIPHPHCPCNDHPGHVAAMQAAYNCRVLSIAFAFDLRTMLPWYEFGFA